MFGFGKSGKLKKTIENRDNKSWVVSDGLKLFNKKQYEEAFNLFLEASQSGNFDGIFYTGYCYAFGKGVKADLRKGISLLCEASDNRDSRAEYALFIIYNYGLTDGSYTVEVDKKKAVFYCEKAANETNEWSKALNAVVFSKKTINKTKGPYAEALLFESKACRYCYAALGNYYFDEGLYKKAYEFYSKASEFVLEWSMVSKLFEKTADIEFRVSYNTAQILFDGMGGVAKNQRKAIEIYKDILLSDKSKLSEEKRLLICECYLFGKFVEKDYKIAAKAGAGLQDKNALVTYAFGMYYLKRGSYSEAESYLKKVFSVYGDAKKNLIDKYKEEMSYYEKYSKFDIAIAFAERLKGIGCPVSAQKMEELEAGYNRMCVERELERQKQLALENAKRQEEERIKKHVTDTLEKATLYNRKEDWTELCKLYYKGIGTAVNKKEALLCAFKAALTDCGSDEEVFVSDTELSEEEQKIFNLARYTEMINTDYYKAASLYKVTAKLGHQESVYRYCRAIWKTQKRGEGVKSEEQLYFEKLNEKCKYPGNLKTRIFKAMDGDPEALYYLGNKYFSYNDKADSDIIYISEVFFEFSLQRYRIFAEEGNTEAMYGIYEIYDTQSSRYYNLYGNTYCRNYEEKMKEEVEYWLTRAASDKYAPALYVLGYKDNGIVELSTHKRLQYAKEAVEAGYAKAEVLVDLGNLQLKQEREHAERVRLYQQSQKNANEWLKELEYDSKLDSMERWMNYKDNGEYKTNWQLYAHGEKSFEEYMSDSWLRDTVKDKGWFKDSF